MSSDIPSYLMPLGGSVVGVREIVVYVGPGDVVSGASAWWGLRAYSSATVSSNAVRLRRDSDNNESDFGTLNNGDLDVAAISSFKGAANLFLVTFYDQTGNGNDLTQATAAQQPAFTLSGLGSLPIITFNSVDSEYLQSGVSPSVTQPVTLSVVLNADPGQATLQAIYSASTNIAVGADHSGPNTAWSFAGSIVTASMTDATWHALQAVINGASSDLNIDGTANTVNPGAASATGNEFFGSNAAAQLFTGHCVEIGRWQSAFSGTQSSNMSTNQHDYWGF